jgi:hypothetical protein
MDAQVPIINFCEHFMSNTSIILSVCPLWLQLFSNCRSSSSTAFSVASFSFSASRATLFADSAQVLACPSCIIACSTFGVSGLTVAAEAASAAAFWQQLERIRHDDPAVVLVASASMQALWGACWRFERVALVSFHSCHTLRKQSISAKPDIHDHDCFEHLPAII